MKSDEFLRQLGARLRAARKKAGLSQDAVARALGQTASSGHAYVSRLEAGKMGNVGIETITRYLQICKAPVAKFMLELAQSGAFGEAEQMAGLEVRMQKSEVNTKTEEERQERARAARRNRERADAAIRAMLRAAVFEAVVPCLKEDWERRQAGVYANGADRYYRAWKRIIQRAAGADPIPAIKATFDELERLGVSQRLNPEAVHKMREVIFERLSGTGG